MRSGSVAICLLVLSCLVPAPALAQVDEDQLGAWYMYFWSTRLEDSRWGFQGDGQYRNWDLGGDLEQLLLRGGVTFSPRSAPDIKFTLGYANIRSEAFGDDDTSTGEDRAYQEALLSQKLARVRVRHRFRLEQRWVEGQSFRTRARYGLFLDIPLTPRQMDPGGFYLAFYNEIFLNGERDIGKGRRVETFDRNRLYGAIGYVLNERFKLQGGYMYQSSDAVDKGQLQISLHHSF